MSTSKIWKSPKTPSRNCSNIKKIKKKYSQKEIKKKKQKNQLIATNLKFHWLKQKKQIRKISKTKSMISFIMQSSTPKLGTHISLDSIKSSNNFSRENSSNPKISSEICSSIQVSTHSTTKSQSYSIAIRFIPYSIQKPQKDSIKQQ